jgi:hypothetical protein
LRDPNPGDLEQSSRKGTKDSVNLEANTVAPPTEDTRARAETGEISRRECDIL